MVSSTEAKTQYMQRESTIVQPSAGMREKLSRASAKYIPACYEFGACRQECGESLAEICAVHTILQAYLLDNFKDVLKSGGVFLCFRAREPAANERHRRCRSEVRTNKTRPDQKNRSGRTNKSKTDRAKQNPTGHEKQDRPDKQNKTDRTKQTRPTGQNKTRFVFSFFNFFLLHMPVNVLKLESISTPAPST